MNNISIGAIIIGFVLLLLPSSIVDGGGGCNASTIDASVLLLSSVKSRLLERRRAKTMNHNRKLLDATTDSSSAIVNGQYIIIFDPDRVFNVTDTSSQWFDASQISYMYDNIAIKGVAVRNVTAELLYELESDPDILSIEPVRKTLMH